MFFKKRLQVGTDIQHIAFDIFGNDTSVLQSRTFSVDTEFPVLTQFAQNAECDYFVSGEFHNISFKMYFPLKVYQTERDRKISHWAFLGSCIVLRSDDLCIRNTYAMSGKPYHQPNDELWQKNGKTRGATIWSEGQNLSPDEYRKVEALIEWVDNEFCALWSTRHAIQVQDGCITIAFWEPDLYDPESQMKLFAEAMMRFRLS